MLAAVPGAIIAAPMLTRSPSQPINPDTIKMGVQLGISATVLMSHRAQRWSGTVMARSPSPAA